MKPWVQGVLGGAGGAALVVIAYVLVTRWPVDDLPAWVQAIGSIAAILFAWAVASRDGRLRREREAAEERRAAEAMYGWLNSARASIEQAAAAIGQATLQANRQGAVVRAALDGGQLDFAATALASIPPDKLGHARAVSIVVETRRSVAMARSELARGAELPNIVNGQLLAALREATNNAHAEITELYAAEGQKLGY